MGSWAPRVRWNGQYTESFNKNQNITWGRPTKFFFTPGKRRDADKLKRCFNEAFPLGKFLHIPTLSLDTFQPPCSFWCKILPGISAHRSNRERQSPSNWWKGSNIPSILYIKNTEKGRLNLCLLCLLRLALILMWGPYGPTAVGSYSGECLGW